MYFLFKVSSLKQAGTFAGNDAIVAFARRYEVNVIIHQYLQPCINVSPTLN